MLNEKNKNKQNKAAGVGPLKRRLQMPLDNLPGQVVKGWGCKFIFQLRILESFIYLFCCRRCLKRLIVNLPIYQCGSFRINNLESSLIWYRLSLTWYRLSLIWYRPSLGIVNHLVSSITWYHLPFGFP